MRNIVRAFLNPEPRTLNPLLALALLICVGDGIPAAAQTADFFVSPAGNDSWSGKLAEPKADKSDGPFATLDKARAAVAELRKAQADRATPVTVEVKGGNYSLAATLTFTPADSGTEKSPTVYAAAPKETPVFSAGRVLSGFKVENGRWTLAIPEVKDGKWNFCQLWADGQRRFRPRLPKNGYFLVADALPSTEKTGKKGFDRFKFADDNIKGTWANLSDVETVVFHTWTMSRFRIEAVDETQKAVTFTGHTRTTQWYGSMPKNRRYFVENVKEALSEPGEWYLDRSTGVLTYVPMPGEDPAKTQIIAPVLDTVLVIKGEPNNDQAVSYITFRGLTFAHNNWVSPAEGNSFPQAEVNLRAAVTADGAKNCKFDNCNIRNTANYAIDLGTACKNNSVVNCTLDDMGAGGVKLGTTNIPSEAKQASDNIVKNCVIAHGGRLHPAAVGVWIGQSPNNTIDHNTITDFYYTGLSLGWTWGYGNHAGHHNTLSWNHVYNIGQTVLSDMGGFYSLGNAEGTTLHHNLFHDIDSFDYGGWGIYFDEGTTHLLAENNIVYHAKTGGFHQHYGKENIFRNNIVAFSRLDQLQRTRDEEHLSFTFEQNIIYFDRGTLFGSNWKNDHFKLTRNLYWRTDGKPIVGWNNTPWKDWQAKGHDVDSVIEDPMFVDPAKFNFALKPGSPAEKLGIKPIDLAGVGSTLLVPAAPRAPAFPIPDPQLPRK
ncbi:MAG: right-handed parallel beta-helix repeat-containing protein [Tepidisphaerales bacterium]